jgi:hypothetical protein
MNLRNFKNGFLFAPWFRRKGIAGLVLVISLTGQAFAEKKLNSVAVMVGDLGNPYFVKIAYRLRHHEWGEAGCSVGYTR